MTTDGKLDRRELAAATGMKLGTFWKRLIAYNAQQRAKGEPPLEPDEIQIERNVPKFLFSTTRVAEFKAAAESMITRMPGRPRP